MYPQLYYYTIVEIITLFVKTIHINTKDNDSIDTVNIGTLLVTNSSMLLYTLFYFIINALILYMLCSYNLQTIAWVYFSITVVVLCIRIYNLLSSLISKVVNVPKPKVEQTLSDPNLLDTIAKAGVSMDPNSIPSLENITKLYN
jgi:hypothetical protein|tara:strand:+ start:485 stop:916 length:432 start_codon:yes stop_codon:yes gene_type:complete